MVSSAEFDTLLPHIALPALRGVQIKITLYALAFTEFLTNHPTITRLEYMSVDTVPVAFTTHPLVLPHLTRISCLTAERLVPLLDAFQLCTNLSTIRKQRGGETRG
jgi:hypothetical protein